MVGKVESKVEWGRCEESYAMNLEVRFPLLLFFSFQKVKLRNLKETNDTLVC